MLKGEGVPALWKGAIPTVIRATAYTSAQLISYDICKEKLTKLLPDETHPLITQSSSSVIASIAVALFVLPFDNVKTKLMKQKAGKDGKLPYKGLLDTFGKTF